MTAPAPTDPEALRSALEALAPTLERHEQARQARDWLRIYASAAEAVWWLCAVDEHLGGNRKQPTPYARARDADPDGQCIDGLRWVRDRHTHQLPITTGGDTRNMFDTRGRGVIYIASSRAILCRRVEDVRSNAKRDAVQPGLRQRQIYADRVSERDTLAVRRGAQRWLQAHLPPSQPSSP